jgi:ATP-binding cassette, subfamily B, bacterial PglK
MASLLLVMILVGSVLEMIGVGVILPLVTLFSDSNPLEVNSFLKRMHDWLKPETQTQFIVWVLASSALFYMVKNIYLFFIARLQACFTQRQQHELSCRLFQSYLSSPYEFHLKYNSSELLRNIKLIVTVISGVLIPLIIAVTELMIVFFIFLLLVWVDSTSAMLVTLGLGVFLWGYHSLTKTKMTLFGEEHKYHEGKTYQQVYQSFSSIKEIKVLGLEKFFNEAFSNHVKKYTQAYSRATVFTQSGKFIFETVGVSVLLGVMALSLSSGENPNTALVEFSLFAVALVRLMPTVSRLSWAFTQIKFGIPSLNEVFDQLKICEKRNKKKPSQKIIAGKLIYEDQIEFCKVSYRYEGAEKLSLDAVSFVIPKNSTVGLVGSSGAGKTTAVDLTLGLLKPLSGDIFVDGKDIHESLFSWQQQIGYVPQSIYLLDDTVRNNVAFGMEYLHISDEKVWMALRLAQLEFFVSELPNGLDTLVGEDGVRFSGGQRQRIGIARALYHEPQVVIMDEATAALDNETELAFMSSIEGLYGERTIILVAHRMTTVEKCDTIFFFSDGRLIASGSYDFLFSTNPEFRQMAQL